MLWKLEMKTTFHWGGPQNWNVGISQQLLVSYKYLKANCLSLMLSTAHPSLFNLSKRVLLACKSGCKAFVNFTSEVHSWSISQSNNQLCIFRVSCYSCSIKILLLLIILFLQRIQSSFREPIGELFIVKVPLLSLGVLAFCVCPHANPITCPRGRKCIVRCYEAY